MLRSLQRVLRIRALEEEIGRQQMEVERDRLRAIEAGSEQAARAAAVSRGQSFSSVEREGRDAEAGRNEVEVECGQGGSSRGSLSAGGEGRPEPRPVPHDSGAATPEWPGEAATWREAESLWELAVWRRRGFEGRRPGQQALLDEARTKFLAGRRERLQAEILVEAARAAERLEQGRGEQRALDDWFQAWSLRIRENAPKG